MIFKKIKKYLNEAGYDHYRNMSNNAVAAYEDGSRPLSKWTKLNILKAIESYPYFEKNINMNKFKKLSKEQLVIFLKYDGWHHTGINYRKTSFYTLNTDVIELYNDDAFDFEDLIEFNFNNDDVMVLCSLLDTSIEEFTKHGIYYNEIRNKFSIYLEDCSFRIINWKEIKHWTNDFKNIKDWKKWINDCKYDYSLKELKEIKKFKNFFIYNR